MEVRGEAKEIGMPNSIGYTTQFNQESSSAKLSSTPVGSILPERRNDPSYSSLVSPNQTLVQPHLTQHHHDHQLNQHHHQQQEQEQEHKHRYVSPDPDLDTSETIADAPSSKTASTQPRLPPAVSTTSGNTSVRYRECLKNHAASLGGHVLDGCGEFMPSGEEGTPEVLKCAACDCHRSFHRKEVDGESQTGTNHYSTTYYRSLTNNTAHRTTIHPRPPPPPPSLPAVPPQQQHRQHHKYAHGYTRVFSTSPSTGHLAPMMMAFGGNNGGAPAESSSEDLNMFQYSNAGTQAAMQPSYSISKKRFRTKFTQQQKDKMHEFAEKLGWTMQKQDERQVQQFCDEVGVKRQVFKVWMHNNKQAMKKKQM